MFKIEEIIVPCGYTYTERMPQTARFMGARFRRGPGDHESMVCWYICEQADFASVQVEFKRVASWDMIEADWNWIGSDIDKYGTAYHVLYRTPFLPASQPVVPAGINPPCRELDIQE